MIATAHVRLMARYNCWQNESIYAAAASLTDAERRLDRGAFFRSIHGTLSHLVWGDSTWMHRFAGTPKPAGGIKDSPALFEDWDLLAARRRELDEAIMAWASSLGPEWLEGSTGWYSGAMGRDMSKPNWLLAAHFFNHQTHHRGQVHAMLTAAGARPDDTDLMVLEA